MIGSPLGSNLDWQKIIWYLRYNFGLTLFQYDYHPHNDTYTLQYTNGKLELFGTRELANMEYRFDELNRDTVIQTTYGTSILNQLAAAQQNEWEIRNMGAWQAEEKKVKKNIPPPTKCSQCESTECSGKLDSRGRCELKSKKFAEKIRTLYQAKQSKSGIA